MPRGLGKRIVLRSDHRALDEANDIPGFFVFWPNATDKFLGFVVSVAENFPKNCFFSFAAVLGALKVKITIPIPPSGGIGK